MQEQCLEGTLIARSLVADVTHPRPDTMIVLGPTIAAATVDALHALSPVNTEVRTIIFNTINGLHGTTKSLERESIEPKWLRILKSNTTTTNDDDLVVEALRFLKIRASSIFNEFHRRPAPQMN